MRPGFFLPLWLSGSEENLREGLMDKGDFVPRLGLTIEQRRNQNRMPPSTQTLESTGGRHWGRGLRWKGEDFQLSAPSVPRKEQVMDIQEQTSSCVPTAARHGAFDLI